MVTALAGLTHYVSGVPDLVAFLVATVALAGGAWMLSFATEQVGERLGPAVTGFMHSSLGNLPEFFVVLFALRAGERIVAETAILGSILVNALLVLGLVIIVGAHREGDGVMRFGRRLPTDTATLLLVSSFIIVLVGLADSSRDPASHHIETISIICAPTRVPSAAASRPGSRCERASRCLWWQAGRRRWSPTGSSTRCSRRSIRCTSPRPSRDW